MMPAMVVSPWLNWVLVGASVLLLAGYEWHVVRTGRRDPRRNVRYTHARMRTEWVKAMSAQPGFEIVAVQALRNSLMSATISASTAALAADHVRRGGLLYSWGLRLVLMVAAVVAGIVHPWAMLPVTLLLLVALHHFDRPVDLDLD